MPIGSPNHSVMVMSEPRPLFIPVILGTTRQGRMSAHAAQFIFGQLQMREGIATELIDIATLSIPVDDAGEAIKDPRFAASGSIAPPRVC